MTTLTATATDAEGHISSATATFPTPAAGVSGTLFGVDLNPLDLTVYPKCAYCRLYNPPGTGAKKIATPKSVALPHVSQKDTPTVANLAPMLDPLDRPILWEFHHEPEGDMAAADYVAQTKAGHQLIRSHPNGHFVRFAQTFTRYAQVHHNKVMSDGVKADWQNLWVADTQVFGLDCEFDSAPSGYPDPQMFFSVAVAASKTLGVPFVIPELGWHLLAGDDGTGLAAWYTACANYLRSVGCLAVAAYESLGTTGDYRLAGTPSRTAWQSAVAAQ